MGLRTPGAPHARKSARREFFLHPCGDVRRNPGQTLSGLLELPVGRPPENGPDRPFVSVERHPGERGAGRTHVAPKLMGAVLIVTSDTNVHVQRAGAILVARHQRPEGGTEGHRLPVVDGVAQEVRRHRLLHEHFEVSLKLRLEDVEQHAVGRAPDACGARRRKADADEDAENRLYLCVPWPSWPSWPSWSSGLS